MQVNFSKKPQVPSGPHLIIGSPHFYSGSAHFPWKNAFWPLRCIRPRFRIPSGDSFASLKNLWMRDAWRWTLASASPPKKKATPIRRKSLGRYRRYRLLKARAFTILWCLLLMGTISLTIFASNSAYWNALRSYSISSWLLSILVALNPCFRLWGTKLLHKKLMKE